MARDELNLPPLPTPNRPPPPNFNFVECPKEVINIRPPLIKKPQSDINDFKYFYYCDVGDGMLIKLILTNTMLRNLFRNPLEPWEKKLDTLLMEDPDGVVSPAHLPNVMDLLRLLGPGKVLFYHLMDKLVRDPDCPLFPPSWEEFVDPPRQVRDYGRIFLLRLKRCVVANANNADGLDIFHVLDHITHIEISMWSRWTNNPKVRNRLLNISQITCGIFAARPTIPLHSPLVVWNVRGVNRLDFPQRFIEVIATHQPVVVILTETRSLDAQFEEVFTKLGTEKWWISSEGSGLSGGVIVMWDATLLDVTSKRFFIGNMPILTTVMKVKN